MSVEDPPSTIILSMVIIARRMKLDFGDLGAVSSHRKVGIVADGGSAEPIFESAVLDI